MMDWKKIGRHHIISSSLFSPTKKTTGNLSLEWMERQFSLSLFFFLLKIQRERERERKKKEEKRRKRQEEDE